MAFFHTFPVAIDMQEIFQPKAVWIFFAFLGLILLLFLVHKIRVFQKKRKFVQVEGHIIHVEKTDHPKRGPEYRFAVSFKTVNGQTYDLVCTKFSAGFAHAEYGDVLNIYYNPNNPNDFYAEHRDSHKNTNLTFYRTGIFR